MRRPSLPLTADDLHDLDLLRRSSALRSALEAASGVDLRGDSPTEAALLHAIWRAGVAAVLEEVEAAGYALVAGQMSDADVAERHAVARLTTTPKPALGSIVELGPGEVLTGRVVCVDIGEIYADEVKRDLGALSPAAMAAVGRGLAAALGL